MKTDGHVTSLSNKVVKQLKPLCKKIQIVGSIRRGEQNPKDIDLVLIPKSKEKIEYLLRKFFI